MKNREDDAYTCPSFNYYSAHKLAEIAVKIAAGSEYNDVSDENFEFATVLEDKEVSTGDLKIRPLLPVFNRDLLLHNDVGLSKSVKSSALEQNITTSLGKLVLDELESIPPSCSSSESDEFEGVPPGMYCVWRPKAVVTPSPTRCRKSNSMGSTSKWWKIRDLLRRSNSDGKESFVFSTPKHREDKLIEKSLAVPKKAKGKTVGSAASASATPGSPSAHEALYVRNRSIHQGEKKKLYLPYRKDIVGFFL